MTTDDKEPIEESSNGAFECYVPCPLCDHEHTTHQVKFLNIEENMYGEDVLTFVCPYAGVQTSAVVRLRR